MNEDEKVAEEYLKRHHDNVIFEPDGNIPPDFLIENSIGVEVRRLNQQYYTQNGNARGLSETARPFRDRVEKVLLSYVVEADGASFWVGLRYKRVNGELDISERMIKKAIDAFQKRKEILPYEYQIGDNVLLEFIARGSEKNHKYELGIESDLDRGGWVIEKCSDAIKHCIKEKELKIKPYFSKYDYWWLLLVDHMCFMKSEDRVDIVKNITKPLCFERIIVINYEGSSQVLDLKFS
ncbi:hypothetical protein [Nitrosomonas sp. wSCUT-2]